jgi:hypothetical protein
MLTKSKALVAALVVAGSSLALPASAAVPSQGPPAWEQNWFDRSTNGGSGHHPGDTNGGG